MTSLTPEIRDRLLKDQLTKLAKSASSNHLSFKGGFEESAIAYIERYAKSKKEQTKYLEFYRQQLGNQEQPFNPGYLEDFPKI